MPHLPLNEPQFLFDETWIEAHQRLTRQWLPAEVWPEPAIVADRPWESRTLALYGTVLPEPAGGWRLYYSDFTPHLDGVPSPPSPVMVALSRDGLRWEKPGLGLIEHHGDPYTNMVWRCPRRQDAPSLIHDPDDAEWPYKMLAFEADSGPAWNAEWGLYARRSQDGLSWQEIPGRRLAAGDRTNLLPERVDGHYIAYTRHPEMRQRTGGRTIWRTSSRDFGQWSEPELMLAPDLRDAAATELYGFSAFRRHGWYLGLLEVWDADRDGIHTELAISRDGLAWQRPCRTPFIGASQWWNRAWCTPASNGPIEIGDQLVFYFGGRAVSHHFDAARQHGAIGWAGLPRDRFCAIAGRSDGHFTTPAFAWPGQELVLNADCRETPTTHPCECRGQVGIEVLDEQGQPLGGWAGEHAAAFQGNTHCRGQVRDAKVRWPGGHGLSELTGQRLRLRFHLRHARLFTFAAGEPDPPPAITVIREEDRPGAASPADAQPPPPRKEEGMQHRPLGKSGISASVVAFGAWAIGGGKWWGPNDDAESIRALETALDNGINFIDTAPMYGFGHSEEIVGKAIKGKRDKVILATKCGLWWQDDRGSKWFEYEGQTVRRSLRPDTIRQEIEDSLRRLGTDYIDLYQTHWPVIPPDETPIDRTMFVLLQLKRQGKIRAIGVSNVSVPQMQEYLAVGQLDCNQPHYNMLNREAEAEVLPFCRENGIAVLAYSPLEQGLLTGKIGMDRTFAEGETRARRPWFQPANRRRVLDLLKSWQPYCERYNCTLAQLVTAWTLAQPGLTHVLCGARKPEQVVDNAKGGELVLDQADLHAIRRDLDDLGDPL